MRHAWRVVLTLLLPLLAGACATADCKAPRTPIAVYENVPVFNNAPVITVSYNEKPLHLLLDTGAGATVLKPEAVARVDMPVIGAAVVTIHGIGGDTPAQFADSRMLLVAGQHTKIEYVAVVPFKTLPPSVDGILGVGMLRDDAVDIDMPKRRVAFYESNGCTEPPTGFPASAKADDLSGDARYSGNSFQIPVMVDGKGAWAVLDTGAQVTLVDPILVPSSSFVAGAPEVGMYSVDGNKIATHFAKLGELRAGGQTSKNVPVLVGPLRSGEQMLLGASYLGKQHMWLDFSERRVIFAKTGS